MKTEPHASQGPIGIVGRRFSGEQFSGEKRFDPLEIMFDEKNTADRRRHQNLEHITAGSEIDIGQSRPRAQGNEKKSEYD